MARHSCRGRREERGAAAIMVATLMSLVLVGIAAIAVDTGMQRAARRDMQALADVVAMDLARQLDGRTRSALTPVMDTQIVRSRSRNAGTLGSAPEMSWQLGTVSAGAFTPVAPGGVPTAVKVVARTTVDFAFGRAVGNGEGGTSRTAVAQATAGACYTVGSYAARIRLSDGFILGPLVGALGTDVGLSLLDAQGLAGVDVKLVDLVNTGLVAGGFDQLVSTSTTVGRFYLALAQVLSNQGGNAAQVAVLNRLATVAVRDTNIRLGDVLGLDTTGSAALGATANLFDLVSATAFVANGTNAIAVPALNVNVPGVSSLTASLKIGQRPSLVCGRPNEAVGTSSQVVVDLSGNLVNVNLLVAGISAPISISVKVAPSTAALRQVACLSAAKRLDFLVTSGLLSIDVVVGNTSNNSALAVKVLGLTVANGYVRLASRPRGGDTVTGSITVTGDNYANAPVLSVGEGNIGVPEFTADTHLNLLGIPIGGLVNGVVNGLVSIVVNPILGVLDSVLLSPLLEALGINISGADVYARPLADCGIPRLVD